MHGCQGAGLRQRYVILTVVLHHTTIWGAKEQNMGNFQVIVLFYVVGEARKPLATANISLASEVALFTHWLFDLLYFSKSYK